MASVVVPGLDLAPNVPSRIVTVDVVDMTEGSPAAGAHVDFILPQDLHASTDGKVLKAGTTRLTLDSSGHGEIRVPAYSNATKPEDWVLLVKKAWAPYPYPIRVPVGANKISLATLVPPVEVTDAMSKYALTDAAATITEGAQWAVTVNSAGGVASFDFTAPPGGSPGQFAALNASSDINQLTDGIYKVPSGTVAETIGLPSQIGGILTQATTGTVKVQDWVTGGIPGSERRFRRRANPAWNNWVEIEFLRPDDLTVSANPFTSITEGQLLLVPDLATASTAWENEFAGFSSDDFTLWSVTPLGSATSTTGGNRAITWDRFDDTVNVTVQTLAVVNFESESIGGGVTLRHAARASQIMVGVATISGTRSLRVRQYANGGYSTLGAADFAFVSNQFFNLKAQAEGPIIRAKAWQLGDPEPAGWMIETIDLSPQAGSVGLAAALNAYQIWGGLIVEDNGGTL